MMIDCRVRLVALSPKNSFYRFVQSNIYLGIRRSHIQEPRLILVTRNCVIEFKLIENVKRIYQNEINNGKIGVEFRVPPHQLLIISKSDDLIRFIDSLKKMMDKKIVEKMDYIPVIPATSRLKLQTNSKITKNSLSGTSINKNTISASLSQNPLSKVDENLKVLDLPNSNITKIPVKLGQLNVQSINLEGNAIDDENLSWLDEIPIRSSLQFLNLAGNKVKSFPSVLIDYPSLFSLDLKDNCIKYIPGGIGQISSLRYFNLSGNNLRFLPASIVRLKLEEIDVTYNYLTSNSVCHVPHTSKENLLSSLRLQDLAVRALNPALRRKLSYKDCPKRLLDRLRCISQCICNTTSVPCKSAQYFMALLGVKFAITSKIRPQKGDFEDTSMRGLQHEGNGIGNIFLHYHFCTYTDRCEKKKVQSYQSSHGTYSLKDSCNSTAS